MANGDPSLGGIFRRARRKAGLSLAGAAGMIGVSPSYLSRIEKGADMPAEDLVERLADALGLPYGLVDEAFCRARGELRVSLGDGKDRDRILLALARIWNVLDDERIADIAGFLENMEHECEERAPVAQTDRAAAS